MKKDPRISNTSPQDIRFELDELEQVESAQQTWSLRFTNKAMEKRFQLYHEEVSLRSSRVACGFTLLGLVVMQAGVVYDHFVVALPTIRADMDATRWAIVYFGVALNACVSAGWALFYWKTQRHASLEGRFQMALLLLGVCVVLIVLVQPAYAPHFRDQVEHGIMNTDLLDEARQAHQLTKMIVFLFMVLSSMATMWNAQFLVYAAAASFAFGCTWGWFVRFPFYLTQDWHVVLLFLCSVIKLGRALYRSERNLRRKFLRLRHLMLENIKLTQQNTFMQQQLSSHVDAIGINDDTLSKSEVEPQSSNNSAIGESWMENVLKVLYQLKLQLGNSDEVSKDLDFVMQTLTSEQDLFMENRMKRRRMTQSQVDAETGGWLSLIEEQKHRRRKSCDRGVVLNVPLVRTIRRTDSGFRQTVLKQVENYLLAGQRLPQKHHPRQPKLPLLSTDKWTSKKLLARAARSEEFDLLGFAQVCMFPLTSILLTTLESHNLFVDLPIRIECAAEYGLEIESRYQAKNPYHNAV